MPKTVVPIPKPAPFHTKQYPWMDSEEWNYAHRVNAEGLVLCLGERTTETIYRASPDRRRCPECQTVTGRSSL